MPPLHVLYVGMLVASGAVSAVIAVLSWRNRDIGGALPLAVLMLAVTIWAGSKLIELVSPGLSASLFWSNVQYAGIVVVPVAWLLFALDYTGREAWLNRLVVAVAAVEPVVVLLLLWTNGSHHLFRTSTGLVTWGSVSAFMSTRGPAFWAHATYSYVLLGIGTGLILQMVIRSDHLYRRQGLGLLAAVLVPWAGNGLYLAGAVPAGLDPTVIAFALTGIILLGVIARHRLLDVVPVAREVARDELIDRMTDAVVVVDDRGRIVDCNPAAEDVLDCAVPEATGRPLEAVYPPLTEALQTETTDPTQDFQTALVVREEKGFHYYDVRVSALERGFGILTGRLISLRDISEQKLREQRLDVLNRLLRHNHRNEMNVIRGNAALLEEELPDADAQQRIETIKSTVDTVINRSKKVTDLANVSAIATRGSINIADEVGEIVATKRREYPDSEIELHCPTDAWIDAGPAIVTALDELVTNAITHNDASTPTVALSITADETVGGESVRIRVSDNGPGLPAQEIDPILRGKETPLDHSSGVGLWLVTWIVREIGGDIEFTEIDDGVTVTLYLPAAQEPETD